MKTEIRPETMADLQRLVFYDGLVTDVRFQLPIGAPHWTATVTTTVQIEQDGEWKWFYCTFDFEDAREFRTFYDYRTFSVNTLECGVNIVLRDDLVYVDFQPVAGEPDPHATLKDIRASGFYIAAKHVFWSLDPWTPSRSGS